jgi:hypothetical protein
MEQDIIIFSEIKQPHKHKYYVFSHLQKVEEKNN